MTTKKLFPYIAFFLPFAVFVYQLCPTVSIHDSGELITSAHYLGNSHPPGNPLYCSFGKLFQYLIPNGSVAFSMNVMSAFLGSMSCFVLYLIFLRLLSNHIISLTLTFCFGFSPTFWSQSVVTGISTLSTLIIIVSLYLFLEFIFRSSVKHLYCLGFSCGLLLTVHIGYSFIIPVIIMLIVYYMKEQDTKPEVLIILSRFFLFFVLGTTPYLYLPIRSVTDPLIDWGHPDTIELLFDHLIVRNTHEKILSLQLSEILSHTVDYLIILMRDTMFIGLLGFIGIFYYWTHHKTIKYLLIGFLIIDAVTIIFLGEHFIQSEAYGIPSVLVLTIGLIWPCRIFARYKGTWLYGLFLIPIASAFFHFNSVNRNNSFIPSDIALNMLYQVPQESTLFTREETRTFVLLYLQAVEGKRPDVRILDLTDNVFGNYNGVQFHMLLNKEILSVREQIETEIIIEQDRLERNVYFSDPHIPYQSKAFDIKPCGILGQAVLNKSDPQYANYCHPITILRGESDKAIHKDLMTLAVMAMYYYNLSQYQWLTEPMKAIQSLGKASEYNKAYPELHFMIGKSYLEHDLIDEAKLEFQRALDEKTDLWIAQVQMAYVLSLQGEDIKALEHARKALEINDSRAESHQVLALSLAKVKDLNEAEHHFLKSLEVEPKSYRYIYNLARFYIQQEQFFEAELFLRKKLSLYPNDSGLRGLLYQSQMGQKKWFQAIMTAKKLIQIDPSSALHMLYLAEAYYSDGRVNQSLDTILEALILDPTNEQALNMLRRLENIR